MHASGRLSDVSLMEGFKSKQLMFPSLAKLVEIGQLLAGYVNSQHARKSFLHCHMYKLTWEIVLRITPCTISLQFPLRVLHLPISPLKWCKAAKRKDELYEVGSFSFATICHTLYMYQHDTALSMPSLLLFMLHNNTVVHSVSILCWSSSVLPMPIPSRLCTLGSLICTCALWVRC